MNHIVVICDIVESRGIAGRNAFQAKFKNFVGTLNNEFKSNIVSPFTVTLGDEFQGVLKRADKLFLLIHRIQLEFPDISFRIGIGSGTIETEINSQAAIGMDGPAFHFAREAIDDAKEQKRKLVFRGGEKESVLIDQIFVWIEVSLTRWKIEKLKTAYYSRLGHSQKQMQEKIGISQPAISQNLNSMSMKKVIMSEILIENYLNSMIGN